MPHLRLCAYGLRQVSQHGTARRSSAPEGRTGTPSCEKKKGGLFESAHEILAYTTLLTWESTTTTTSTSFAEVVASINAAATSEASVAVWW